jgi:hypothetical protein
MTDSDFLAPVVQALRGAIRLGHARPVVLALFVCERADDVHRALQGKPLPELPPRADGDPPVLLLVRPRGPIVAALRSCCGPAGAWLAAEIDNDGVALDGWLVVVRPDGLGHIGIREGKAVLEGSRSYDAGAERGARGLARRFRSGRAPRR